MRNFKRVLFGMLFVGVIMCVNQVLDLALKPTDSFRSDMHNLETNDYDTIFVGTSHGKAGINPNVVDAMTGDKSLNLCRGGENVVDSYNIVREAYRVNKIKKVVYEMDPGYWCTDGNLGPDSRTFYDEFPFSTIKADYYLDKFWGEDFRVTLFPWYLYKKGVNGAVSRFQSKLTDSYRNYDYQFYDTEVQKFTEKGQIAIQRHETSKDEKNLVLWEENELSKKTITEFDKMVSFCRKKNISLVVVTAPVPQETIEIYRSNFEKANTFFTKFMQARGVKYYNYNYMEVEGFDKSLNGFVDYDGHMFADQADIFSKEIGKLMKEM
ncbi:Uncharacterised protein [uncultured Dorea sp.]|uniref:hypothetical protein n=1 Tax=Dorea formicigenerans TaxID=39486 RepID=UPI00082230A4|nr:hypothetical protein [uncultured Dorea sp.]SCH25563.1 Uncharacterised protein [uncultured Dorea sp.]